MYEGQWKNDRRDGKGSYTWPDGNKYVGEYADGKQEGRGVVTWADGTKFDGEWKDGRFASGTYTPAKGEPVDI